MPPEPGDDPVMSKHQGWSPFGTARGLIGEV
ncbi:MAG: hypothetical protein JWL70_99, partial [Acidimicrobiia bacterium]|nr:hypothetical protein [Acidimicrobiia bacterium]